MPACMNKRTHPWITRCFSSKLIFFVEGHKFLILVDAGTGLLGTASVGLNQDQTKSECLQFFRQLGVDESSKLTIEILVDSEPALGTTLRRLGLPLHLRSASPQAHESVGLAERNFRRCKEMIACIRSDLREHHFDLTCSEESLRRVIQYVAQTHNHYGIGSAVGLSEGLGTRRSPIELVLQKERPAPICTLFGSIVHAKVPESLIELVPERTRFIPAAYLHIKPNSLAHVVSTKVGDRVQVFQAEVKVLNQVVWDPSLAPEVIKEVAGDDHPASRPPDVPDRPLQAQDSDVNITESLPDKGPPRDWVKEHGPTPNCAACNSSSRHGKKHTAPC